MRVSIIVAHDLHKVIGFEGKIPWYIPNDLKRFKELTLGTAVIMGRKTFDSLRRPLAGRFNIVITSSPAEVRGRFAGNGWFTPDKIVIVNSFDEALRKAEANNYDRAFIIGGGEVYRAGLEVADDMYITVIQDHFEGDAFFPDYNPKNWEMVHSIMIDSGATENDETPDYAFYYLKRRRGFIDKLLGFFKKPVQPG